MADVYTDIDNTLDVEVNFDNAPQDINAEEQATDGIQVGAQPEQLLSLIGANERLAATNARLADEILPTLRGGLQTKEVQSSLETEEVSSDPEYIGLGKVIIHPVDLTDKQQSKTLIITANGDYKIVPDNGKLLGEANVVADVHTPLVETNESENISSIGDLIYRDNTNVLEIIDNRTDFSSYEDILMKTHPGTVIQSAFPNLEKITFTREFSLTCANNPNRALLPSNIAKEITLNIISRVRQDHSYFLRQDSKVEILNLPRYETGGGIYTSFAIFASKLNIINLPVYRGGAGGVDGVSQCDNLEYINAPELLTISGYNGGMCSNLPKLRKFYAPKAGALADYGSSFNNCPNLEECILGVVKSMSPGSANLFSNVNMPKLSRLEVQDGTICFSSLRYWTATDVEDVKLNDNFYTYFASRLATRPNDYNQNYNYTLWLNQAFYERIDERNKNILEEKGWVIVIVE